MKKPEKPSAFVALTVDDPREAAHGAEGFDRLTVLANHGLAMLRKEMPELEPMEVVILIADRSHTRQGVGGTFPNAESDFDAQARLIHNLSNALARIAQASPGLSSLIQAAVLKWAGH